MKQFKVSALTAIGIVAVTYSIFWFVDWLPCKVTPIVCDANFRLPWWVYGIGGLVSAAKLGPWIWVGSEWILTKSAANSTAPVRDADEGE